MTRVLIVDDEPESRARLRTWLQAEGHVVTEAANGLDALERARQQPPDLVVSDILMPQMDGFALCRATRSDPVLARTPFVFYTATCTTAADVARATRLGASRFLVKSMAAEEIIRAITDALAQDADAAREPAEAAQPAETESWRLYNEALIAALEHRNLELGDQVRSLTGLWRVLDCLPSAVSLTDTYGRIEFVNRRFEEVTGFARDDVRGQTHAVLRTRHAEAGQAFEIRAALLGGRSWHGEFEHRRRDGTPFFERATMLPVLDERGTVTHFLRVSEDVTAEQARAEAQAAHEAHQRHQRFASAGRLAGGLAHDFNDLLTVVFGHAHLLLGQLPPSDPLREDVEAILDAANRGAGITQQLLTFAQRDVVHPLVLDPAHAIAALARTLQRLTGDQIRLGFSLGPGIWPVLFDPAPFDRMILDLVTNARDATGVSGAVDLSLRNVSLTGSDAASHGGLPAGDYVALRVTDTGPGIPESVLPHVFEPFSATAVPGRPAGLGLASLVGTVEQAGGHVEVERTGAGGTTFLVLLPRADEAPAVVASEAAAGSLDGSERILLVEDEPAVLELVRRTLESFGYTVLHASTPDRAVRAMQESGARVDLLLTDIVMPEMNGRELATQLRGLDPALRVLFMSGHGDDAVTERGLLPADEALITKPFSPTALAARVRDVLSRH